MRKRPKKVPVSRRALTQRINRKLAQKDLKLCACRQNSRGWGNLGDYYVIDVYRNQVVDTHVDIERKAIELECLAEWEALAES